MMKKQKKLKNRLEVIALNKQEFIDAIAKSVKKYAPQFGIYVYSPIIAQAC